MAWNDCVDEIRKAAGGRLSTAEIEKLLQATIRKARRMSPAGALDADGLRLAAMLMAEEQRKAAALAKRNALINMRNRIARRERIGAAKDPIAGMHAEIRGVATPLTGGRYSAEAEWKARARAWRDGVTQELEQAGLFNAVRTGALERELAQELSELSKGKAGNPGVSGSAEALTAARIFDKYQTQAKSALNRAGAAIGDYFGYVTRTSHDMDRIRRGDAGRFERAPPVDQARQTWKDFIRPLLAEETFDYVGGAGGKDADAFLDNVWSALVSGVHLTHEGMQGFKDPAFTGPSNLAKTVSKERVLHFKDALSWLAYQRRFGRGSLADNLLANLDRSARATALMNHFGTNPQAEFLADMRYFAENRRNADPDLAGRIARAAEGGAGVGGLLRNEFDLLEGAGSQPVNRLAARISSGVRVAQSMARLGLVAFTHLSVASTKAAELRYQGANLFERYGNSITSLAPGRSAVHDELLAGLEGMSRSLLSHFQPDDTIPGSLSKLANTFFKWGGLTYLFEHQRQGGEELLAHMLGRQLGSRFEDLTPQSARLLDQFGIGAREWELLRQAPDHLEADGRTYLTPKAAGRIPEAALLSHLYDIGRIDSRILPPGPRAARQMAAFRDDLAMRLYGMFNDRIRAHGHRPRHPDPRAPLPGDPPRHRDRRVHPVCGAVQDLADSTRAARARPRDLWRPGPHGGGRRDPAHGRRLVAVGLRDHDLEGSDQGQEPARPQERQDLGGGADAGRRRRHPRRFSVRRIQPLWPQLRRKRARPGARRGRRDRRRHLQPAQSLRRGAGEEARHRPRAVPHPPRQRALHQPVGRAHRAQLPLPVADPGSAQPRQRAPHGAPGRAEHPSDLLALPVEGDFTMTVASTTNRFQYQGNGATAAFSFPVPFINPVDIGVALVDGDGAALPSALNGLGAWDYQVQGARDVNSGEYQAGAAIVFNTPPEGGDVVTLWREPQITQTVEFTPNDPLPARVLDTALDKGTMIDQWLADNIGRAVRAPVTDPPPPANDNMELPPQDERAGGIMGFDDQGQPIVEGNFALLLSSLSGQLPGLSTITWIDSLMALPAIVPPPAETPLAAMGYRRSGDCGGGLVMWRPAATDPVDNGMVFAGPGGPAAPGRYRRIVDSAPNFNMWGAWGDATGSPGGGHDDTAAIAAALTSGMTTLRSAPGARYRITAPIAAVVPDYFELELRCFVDFTSNDPGFMALTLGGAGLVSADIALAAAGAWGEQRSVQLVSTAGVYAGEWGKLWSTRWFDVSSTKSFLGEMIRVNEPDFLTARVNVVTFETPLLDSYRNDRIGTMAVYTPGARLCARRRGQPGRRRLEPGERRPAGPGVRRRPRRRGHLVGMGRGAGDLCEPAHGRRRDHRRQRGRARLLQPDRRGRLPDALRRWRRASRSSSTPIAALPSTPSGGLLATSGLTLQYCVGSQVTCRTEGFPGDAVSLRDCVACTQTTTDAGLATPVPSDAYAAIIGWASRDCLARITAAHHRKALFAQASGGNNPGAAAAGITRNFTADLGSAGVGGLSAIGSSANYQAAVTAIDNTTGAFSLASSPSALINGAPVWVRSTGDVPYNFLAGVTYYAHVSTDGLTAWLYPDYQSATAAGSPPPGAVVPSDDGTGAITLAVVGGNNLAFTHGSCQGANFIFGSIAAATDFGITVLGSGATVRGGSIVGSTVGGVNIVPSNSRGGVFEVDVGRIVGGRVGVQVLGASYPITQLSVRATVIACDEAVVISGGSSPVSNISLDLNCINSLVGPEISLQNCARISGAGSTTTRSCPTATAST